MKLEDFLEKNRIDRAVWDKSALTWEQLMAIAEDHDAQRDQLSSSAEFFARAIQKSPSVHSVRWRIKNTQNLMEKIIRKCADDQEKYKSIDEKNYFEIVTDLIGLRALHLFKDDCFSIDEHFRNLLETTEGPIAYVREGDPQELLNKFRQLGFEVKQHPAGYRSVHYVFSTQPMRRKVFAEIQVRTIFEEGWSEIDHRVRYPNFSKDKHISYFLDIFNRLAGSADEMGTFVRGLTFELSEIDSSMKSAREEHEKALADMEKLLSEINEKDKQGADANAKIVLLQKEIDKLRAIAGAGAVNSAGVDAALHFYRDKILKDDMMRALNPISVFSAETRRLAGDVNNSPYSAGKTNRPI